VRMVDGRLVRGDRNLARLRRPKPHVKIQYLEADFAELFCHGLAGLGPGGLEDEGFRGRFPGRNAAMGGLVLGTGMRSREFNHLLVHEVPPLPAEPTGMPIPWAVPEMAAKGRKFRTTWIDYGSLAAVHFAAATGDAAGLALYLLKADPLLILRDLLGHSSVTTTEVYLKRLDVHRIYRAAWDNVGTAPDGAALAEADAEFAEEEL
jgi:hypothetical protein